MSAFMCSPEHIATLVAFYAAMRDRYHNKEERRHYCQLLVIENDASVCWRYDEPVAQDTEFYVNLCMDRMPRYEKDTVRRDVVSILKLARCYQYQSCEHPKWEGSRAKMITSDIIDYCIDHLPGYEEAPWTI